MLPPRSFALPFLNRPGFPVATAVFTQVFNASCIQRHIAFGANNTGIIDNFFGDNTHVAHAQNVAIFLVMERAVASINFDVTKCPDQATHRRDRITVTVYCVSIKGIDNIFTVQSNILITYDGGIVGNIFVGIENNIAHTFERISNRNITIRMNG